MKYPLLITATFDAGRTPHVALRDVQKRVEHHMEGLLAWFKDPLFDSIVFVKNCSTSICESVLYEVAEAHRKKFELLQVASSALTEDHGKGYGEGHLISQALVASKILQETDTFCKSTGKLYLCDAKNYFSESTTGVFFTTPVSRTGHLWAWRRFIVSLYRTEWGAMLLAKLHRNCHIPWSFMAAAPRGWIDTRFYQVKKEFYKKRIELSYLRVQDALGYSLEAAYFDDLFPKPEVSILDQNLNILGTSGTLGTTGGCFPLHIQKEARSLAAKLLLPSER